MGFEIAIILIGAFAAAFVTGVAGFGDALIASAIWLQFLMPIETVPLVVACFFAMHIVLLALMRKELDFRHLWPFLLAGAACVPIGTKLLTIMEPDTFKMIAGGGLLIYGTFMLLQKQRPRIHVGGKWLDGLMGGIGGVLGGFAGLSGFVPGIWCAQRGWPRNQSRGVTQPYILAMHGMALGWLAFGGMVSPQVWDRFLIAIPAIAAGAWLGLKLYHRFDDRKFRTCVFIVLIIAGAVLLVNPGAMMK